MGKISLSYTTLAAILLGYVIIIGAVVAATTLNIEKPSYIDITVSTSQYTVNSVFWVPDITTKTFNSVEINMTYTGEERNMTITTSFLGLNEIEVAWGQLITTIGPGTSVYSIVLTWDGHTTDDIVSGRIMII